MSRGKNVENENLWKEKFPTHSSSFPCSTFHFHFSLATLFACYIFLFDQNRVNSNFCDAFESNQSHLVATEKFLSSTDYYLRTFKRCSTKSISMTIIDSVLLKPNRSHLCYLRYLISRTLTCFYIQLLILKV